MIGLFRRRAIDDRLRLFLSPVVGLTINNRGVVSPIPGGGGLMHQENVSPGMGAGGGGGPGWTDFLKVGINCQTATYITLSAKTSLILPYRIRLLSQRGSPMLFGAVHS